jgi:S1-C subfamily serine protease
VVHQRQDIALGPEQIPCDVIRIELATDLAILRVKEGNHPYPQVELTPDEPHIQLGAPVAVMGWPALERLQYESPITVFGQVALLDATVTVNDRGVRVFVMDLPGLGGMSGGPVIDMATNAIIGLHAGTVRARAEANGPPELRRLEVYERALGYAIPRRSLEAILAEAS